MFELRVDEVFAAAHFLNNYEGPCENMHGHNYKVETYVRGENLDPKIEFLVDFKVIKTELKAIFKTLDHTVLNEVMSVNPTAENIAKYIYSELKKQLPDTVQVYKVVVWETPNCAAAYFE